MVGKIRRSTTFWKPLIDMAEANTHKGRRVSIAPMMDWTQVKRVSLAV